MKQFNKKQSMVAVLLVLVVAVMVAWQQQKAETDQGELSAPPAISESQELPEPSPLEEQTESGTGQAKLPTLYGGPGPVIPSGGQQTESGAAQEQMAGLVFDETDPRTADEYSDAELSYWSAGTFNSKQDSLRYHFNKHGEELPAYTVAAYLNQAYATRAEVLQSADGWRVTESSGANAAHKYKNQQDDRFIILDDETEQIYSFGR